MKATELRIGNWVMYNDLSMEPIPKPIQIDVQDFILIQNKVMGCVYNPIPLTPEILLKAGFVSNPYQDRYEKGDLHFEYCAIRNIIWSEKYTHINFVNQLQNLYFALTGEELEIEL